MEYNFIPIIQIRWYHSSAGLEKLKMWSFEPGFGDASAAPEGALNKPRALMKLNLIIHRAGQGWAGKTTLGHISIMALPYIAMNSVEEEGIQLKKKIEFCKQILNHRLIRDYKW